MKSNMKDIEETVCDASSNIKVDLNGAMKLRADYGILEHEIAKSFNENLTEFMREIFKVEGRLKKAVKEDTAELNDIKGQLVNLIKEKILLQETVHCTTSRVSSIEELVGCEFNKQKNEENVEQKEMLFNEENYIE